MDELTLKSDGMRAHGGGDERPDGSGKRAAGGEGKTAEPNPESGGYEKREGDIAGHPVLMFGLELKGTPKLAIFISTRDIIEAEMKAGWLGANGIPCIVTGRATSSAVFGNMFDASKMNLLVPEDKLEEAEKLIEILEIGDNLSLAEEDSQ